MNKKAILGAAFGLLLSGNAYATQNHDSAVTTMCNAASMLAHSVAEDRDEKIPSTYSKGLIDSMKQDPQLSAIEYHLIDEVYGNWTDLSPDEIKTLVLGRCLGEE